MSRDNITGLKRIWVVAVVHQIQNEAMLDSERE